MRERRYDDLRAAPADKTDAAAAAKANESSLHTSRDHHDNGR